ncbi:MAG: tRNA-dihydrouridine synthase [Patescibacteria group bacterium]
MNFWSKLKKPIMALAPMAGVTDSAFRQLCREYGADVVYTEMVSADGLFYDSKKTLEFLKFNKSEKPVVIQLFGKHPEKFTKAAQLAEAAGFDGIDINFGCPAKKVAGHGGGVTLMRDLQKCREIIEAVLAGTKLPVSVKLRGSIKNGNTTVTTLDFIKAIKDLPVATIMIHGRPYENPFNSEIDYEMIKKAGAEFIKNNPKGIVLANGGITCPEEAKTMLELTGAHGLGVARGVYGRPWISQQIKDHLKTGKYREFTHQQIKQAIISHAQAVFKAKDKHGLIELRKHLLWYVKGWPNAKELRSQLVAVESLSDIKTVCKNI